MLAIAGGKGGSGKTTTTLGLAGALDGPTLAVDADRDMPNLHALAGVDREPTLAAVGRRDGDAPTEAWTETRNAATETDSHTTPDPLTVAQSVGAEGAVLPAPRTDADVDLRELLLRLRFVDAATLLDCPAGAGPDAALPLRVADGVLLVSPLCAAALRDAAKTAAMARALDTPVVGAVLTRTRLAPAAVSDLLDCPVLASVPAVRPPVLERDVVRAAYARLAAAVAREESLL